MFSAKTSQSIGNRPSSCSRPARSVALCALAALAWLAIGAGSAQAQFWSSSRLLLPYFEIDLGQDLEEGQGPRPTTTLVAVVNTSDETITVHAEIYSNWGIEILESRFEIEARGGYTANLAEWVLRGTLPDRQLTPDQTAHVTAALSGQRSPNNDMYYSNDVLSRITLPLAVGYATFWTLGDENSGETWKDLELILNRYSMSADPYYATAWFTQEQVGVWNWERFRSDEFDQLHADAQAELDVDKRSAMYQKAQDLMEESGAYRFITHEATPVIYRNSIKPALRPDGLPLLRYFEKA